MRGRDGSLVGIAPVARHDLRLSKSGKGGQAFSAFSAFSAVSRSKRLNGI